MSALLGHAPATRPTEPAELTQYLFEKYGQRVFTFCYSRLRNREEAQDAAQTTFIYVMRSLQRGVEPEFELAWLLKIAFNVCRGVRRSTGRETAVTQEVEDIDELAAPPAASSGVRATSSRHSEPEGPRPDPEPTAGLSPRRSPHGNGRRTRRPPARPRSPLRHPAERTVPLSRSARYRPRRCPR